MGDLSLVLKLVFNMFGFSSLQLYMFSAVSKMGLEATVGEYF